MADVFNLSGAYTVTPASGVASADPSITAPVAEGMVLSVKHYDDVAVAVDTPVAVAFGGVTLANLVLLKVVSGGPVRARLTSAYGATQAVPVEDFFVMESASVPVTAIDLTRTPGVNTTVKVLLGQKA